MRERFVLGAFVAATIIFAVIGAIGLYQVNRHDRFAESVEHDLRVLGSIEQALGSLRDLEAGQGGYLVTGDERFLAPYEAASDRLNDDFQALRLITGDVPEQQAELDRLKPLFEQKLAFTKRAVELYRSGAHDEAWELVRTGEGRELQARIHRALGTMKRDEAGGLAEAARRADLAAWRAAALVLFGDAFAFALLTTGVILMSREFDRQRRLERELALTAREDLLVAEAERDRLRLRAAVEEMPVGVALVDAPGAPPSVHNAHLRELMGSGGAQRGELPPLTLLDADGEPPPLGQDPVARAMSGTAMSARVMHLQRPDGNTREVLVSGAPVTGPTGEAIAAVLTVQDHAEVHRIQEQRESSERFRDLFLSALGHDLRNPLTVITAGTGALARRTQTEEQAKVIARMASSAERMDRMVGQLIDLTRVRLGGFELERQPVDAGAVAKRVVEREEVLHPERAFEQCIHGDLGGTWDPEHLERAVDELVRNAVEHGEPGTPIGVAAWSDDGETVIQIHNEGPPIPEELRGLAFDPFERAGRRKRTRSLGLGLGLYLADQIVSAHGGRITLDSTADRGTTFRIVLPTDHG